MILLVDNYDSFTWNIRHALVAFDAVEVVRNDALSAAEALALRPDALVLGPGPGRPADAGLTMELLASAPPELPILGVCLGHQALIEHYGGSLERDPAPTHGKSSAIAHHAEGLYTGLPQPLEVGRYHSLRSSAELPADLALDAWTPDGIVMGVRHRQLPRWGVQFHPESILSPHGAILLRNFVKVAQRFGYKQQ